MQENPCMLAFFILELTNYVGSSEMLVEDDRGRKMDDVFTEDKRKRRMSSFHSLFFLDVTLHLFISFLNGGSNRERGVVRVWRWKYQVTLNIEPHLSHKAH